MLLGPVHEFNAVPDLAGEESEKADALATRAKIWMQANFMVLVRYLWKNDCKRKDQLSENVNLSMQNMMNTCYNLMAHRPSIIAPCKLKLVVAGRSCTTSAAATSDA